MSPFTYNINSFHTFLKMLPFTLSVIWESEARSQPQHLSQDNSLSQKLSLHTSLKTLLSRARLSTGPAQAEVIKRAPAQVGPVRCALSTREHQWPQSLHPIFITTLSNKARPKAKRKSQRVATILIKLTQVTSPSVLYHQYSRDHKAFLLYRDQNGAQKV